MAAIPFKIRLFIVIVFVSTGLGIERFFSPGISPLRFFPLKCPLKAIFDISCPTCGLGRSLWSTWLGHYQKGLEYHILGPFIFLFGLGVFLIAIPLRLKKTLKIK